MDTLTVISLLVTASLAHTGLNTLDPDLMTLMSRCTTELHSY